MTTYRLFPSTDGPSTPASYGSNPIVVGVQFQVNTGGCWLDGYWWWVCPSEQPTQAQLFALWQAYTDVGEGNLIASATVESGTLKAGEWNFVELSAPVPLSIGATYIAATGLTGDFPTTNNQFGGSGPYSAGITAGPLFAYSDITQNGGSAPAPTELQQAVYSTAAPTRRNTCRARAATLRTCGSTSRSTPTRPLAPRTGCGPTTRSSPARYLRTRSRSRSAPSSSCLPPARSTSSGSTARRASASFRPRAGFMTSARRPSSAAPTTSHRPGQAPPGRAGSDATTPVSRSLRAITRPPSTTAAASCSTRRTCTTSRRHSRRWRPLPSR